MANVFTAAMRYKRDLDKRMKMFEDTWVAQELAWYEANFTDDDGRPLNTSMQRPDEQDLRSQYNKYVAPARRAELEDKMLNGRIMDDLVWGWKVQYTMAKAKERAAEELGVELNTPNTFFITVRPDEKKTTFQDFYAKVASFTKRQCFLSYTLSFEQKGTSDDTLGQGFHVHIVARMKQRSKGEVLRDTQNTFKHCAAANCIDVSLAPRPKELVQNYLVDYNANDGHKQETKQWDAHLS